MRLKSTTRKGVLAILLCLPLVADAVGLGKLTVNSNLGQVLNADLELVALRKEELGSLNIRMASPSAFSQANIQYAPYLPKIKFTLDLKPDGKAYYKVTSAQPITEPFVVMLIELNWAAGKLVREYTVLLDPPEMRRAQPLESAAVSDKPLAEGKTTSAVQLPQAPAPEIAPAPAPVAVVPPAIPTIFVTPPPEAEAVPAAADKQTADNQKTEEPKSEVKPEEKQAQETVPGVTSTETTTASAESTPEPKAAAAETYQVSRGDTLAEIAKKVKPEEVSLEQMMLALYRANKDAFDGRNMNRLKTGQILTIPEKDVALDVEQADAKRLIRAQAVDWNAYRQKVAEKAAKAAADKPQVASQSATGTISAKAEDKVAPPEPTKDQLKLSKSETLTENNKAPEVKAAADVAAKTSAQEAAKMQERINALQEESIAKEKAVKEANSRVTDLEKTVKNLQEVLSVKNKTLEDLQKQAEAAKAAMTKPAEKKPEVTVTEPKVEAKPEPVVTVNPAPVKSETPESKPTIVTNPAPTPATEVKPESAAVTPAPVATETQPVQPAPKPVTKPAQPDPLAAEAPSIIDEFLSNPVYPIGAVGLVIVLAVVVYFSLRRKKNYSGFEDSIITGGDLKANTVFGNTGGGVVSTGDNSFITDFSREGLGAIDADEVDPIAEAEVYMAYGRDTQAEEILKDALQKDPNRHQIHLKLLEIYANRKNTTAFETLASELYAATGGQGEHWVKAAELGKTLDPGNPLYGKADSETAAKIQATTTAAALAAMAPDELDFNKTLTKTAVNLSPATAAPAPAPKAAEVSNLDFNLDTTKLAKPIIQENSAEKNLEQASFDIAATMPPPKANGSRQSAPANELSLDVSAFGSGSANTEKPLSLGEELTFDLGDLPGSKLEASTDQAVVELEPAPNEQDLGLNFDFNPPSNLGESAAAPASAPKAPEIKSEIDLSSINLSFDTLGASADAESASMNFEPDTSPESVWQQVATKLDLARAYQEMGDQEGAREILQEVVQEGDAKQKQDAEQLLAKLH